MLFVCASARLCVQHQGVPGTNDLLLGGQGEERICSVDNIGLPDNLNTAAASQECLIQIQRLLK